MVNQFNCLIFISGFLVWLSEDLRNKPYDKIAVFRKLAILIYRNHSSYEVLIGL